jgi:hypothetical protein
MGWIARKETVVAPDERVWTVRRVLLPRPPRWIDNRRKPADDQRARDWGETAWGGIEFGSGALDAAANGPTALVVALIVFLVLLLLWAFLIPALFFLFDLLIVLMITLAGGAVRVLFRRPWKIEARTDGLLAEQHTWGVVGVRASDDAVHTVAYALSRGMAAQEIRFDADR